MAGETQEPRIGWGGEVWLHNGTALTELKQVVSFGLPEDETDEVEVTHLKSPQKRREFIAGLTDGGEVEVVLNYRPGSDTDALIRAARAAGNARAVRFIIPDEDGTPGWQVDTTAIVRRYARGEVAAEDKIEATMTLRITGAQTEAAAA